MAKNKNTEKNQVQVEAQEKENSPKNEQNEPKIQWADMTNAQRDESIKKSFASIIVKTAKTAREENKPEMAFWNKNMTLEEIDNTMPYNPCNGKPYENTTQVILRCIVALNGYDIPLFLTANEANRLEGKLKKELDENGKEKLTENGKTAYVKGVKIPYIKKGEWVAQKDDMGNPILIQAKDREGKPRFDEKGEPIMREAKEYKEYIKPILETTTLYHISQFDDLNYDKFVDEMDTERLNRKRDYFAHHPERALNTEFVTSLGISAHIAEKLHYFIKASKTGKDFVNQNIKATDLDKDAKKEFVPENTFENSRSF